MFAAGLSKLDLLARTDPRSAISEMILGYNTNGLTARNAVEAIEFVAEVGYRAIALTLNHDLLNPFDPLLERQIEDAVAALDRHQMRSVIETGARLLLDPHVKHEPTLVTAEPSARARRIDFLVRAIDIAAVISADCVSLWSGRVRDGAGDREAMRRLVGGLAEVLDYAASRDVVLGFEPEPEMFIDTQQRFADLLGELDRNRIDASRLRLTLDVGHLHCQGETPIACQIRQWSNRLVNVHMEDMRLGVHEHLMFGDGEIDFGPVVGAFEEIHYGGTLNVELSRHSHEGAAAARRAYNFLSPLLVETSGDR
jgi:L-ribulose-5-phosphate 3-epimerase